MGDDLRLVGENIKVNQDQIGYTFTRDSAQIPIITRIRDVFDSTVAFEMEFESYDRSRVLLGLTFSGPPAVGCCADCFCTVCDEFTGSADAIKELTFPYLEGSVTVFKNLVQNPQFVESDPTSRIVTLTRSITTSDVIRICYIYKYTGNCTGNPNA